MIHLKSPREIDLMRRSGARLASVFVKIRDLVKPGVETSKIDRMVDETIRGMGGKPAFKGYSGGDMPPFPASTCISIDREVVHGIPSSRRLQKGEIVGIDIGLELDGWYADMACSFLVGEVAEEHRRLWSITREALYRAIDQARPGNYLSDLGGAVQDWVERNRFSVIRDLVGHGIGSELHEEPAVPNYRSRSANVRLHAGMTLAIEPMVAAGTWRIKVLPDGWTAVTADGKPSAHFEHTVLISNNGPRILTLLEDGRDPWSVICSNEG